jgi:hypothetical protein
MPVVGPDQYGTHFEYIAVSGRSQDDCCVIGYRAPIERPFSPFALESWVVWFRDTARFLFGVEGWLTGIWRSPAGELYVAEKRATLIHWLHFCLRAVCANGSSRRRSRSSRSLSRSSSRRGMTSARGIARSDVMASRTPAVSLHPLAFAPCAMARAMSYACFLWRSSHPLEMSACTDSSRAMAAAGKEEKKSNESRAE